MIIMSQDKTEIINFDNVNTLRATKTGFIVSYENTYKPEDDCSNILGKYETEERAKEVLEEISLAFAYMEMIKIPKINIHQTISAAEMVRNICYKMPEE